MALGVVGFGCEDALVHLMNYVWPNIFETSPHMMQSFNDAVEGFRVSVGPGRVLLYTLQVSLVSQILPSVYLIKAFVDLLWLLYHYFT